MFSPVPPPSPEVTNTTPDSDNSDLTSSSATEPIMDKSEQQPLPRSVTNQRSFIDSWGSFIKAECVGDGDTMEVTDPITFDLVPSPPAAPVALQPIRDLDHGRTNSITSPLAASSPINLERKRKCIQTESVVDYTSDDGDDDSAFTLLNLFGVSKSMKRLKLLGNGMINVAGTGHGPQGRLNEIAMNNLREVHITQPSSTPSSPISSPRPVTSLTSSPTPPLGSQQHLQQNTTNSQTVSVVGKSSLSTQSQGSLGALALSYQHCGHGTGTGNSTPKDDWELTKVGIRERNAAMCNQELMADVYFIVSANGGETVRYPAHKYVLAVGSSVFYAMFYGSLAETTKDIVVPDVEPEAFLKMLQYLYSDEIDLNEDCVLATLHVAKKYIIPQLARACVQYLESSLTAKNSCVLLSQSRIFDEPELMDRCWEVIDAQAELALTSEGFLEIDPFTLESILSRETLKCKELSIFNAAIAWAVAECERREIETTPGNLRASLGNALQLIRVPTMELKEFADGPAQTGIFSLEESHAIFLHFTATNKPKVGYSIVPRAGLTPQVCHRFQSSAYRSNQWRYRGRCDSIQFCVDRRIFIVGFGLYGSSGGAATYAVHIELKRMGRVLAENDTEFFSDGSSNTFHVYFDQPVQVDPDTYYTASAVLDGMELSYFGQEGMTDVQVGNVTFQYQCSAESTNGTGVQGGQIPELIFYGPTERNSSTANKVQN